MGCQKCGARKKHVHSSHPSLKYMSFCYIAGEFSAREREYGSRYHDATRAGFRGARGSYSTCYTVAACDPADVGEIRNPLKELRNWSRIRNYAMLRPPLWQSVVVVLDDR